MEIAFLILSVLSILVMFYALVTALGLRNKIPGGKVRSTWNTLVMLIVIFSLGYISTPFFRLLPPEIKDVLVGIIFLAGAAFVVIVIKLFYKIVEDLGL
jgi:hypothetical protein